MSTTTSSIEWFRTSDRLPRVMHAPGVYAIRHVPSGACYVGSSVCCRSRLWRHLYDLRRGRHFSARLQRAWGKHGEAEFAVAVLEFVPKDELIRREQVWIDGLDSYRSGLNERPVAEANYGVVWTQEQNAARRDSNRATWANQCLREELSKRFRGRQRGNWTDESHRKVSATLRERHLADPAWHRKMSDALSDPAVQRRRVEGVQRSLGDAGVYSARVEQLRQASASPVRLQHLREAYFAMHGLASHGLHTPEDLDRECARMYLGGDSTREIGRRFGIDHKSIAARLVRMCIRIRPRGAARAKERR